MIVIKFGGSAVKDAPAMQKVIDWVKGEVAKGSMPVVVVSALALVTNHLTEVSELIRDGKLAAAHHLLNSIARRHDYMALSLWLHMGNRLRNEFERLKSVVLNGNFPRFMDEVLAAGELASSQLLTEVLCRVGLQSQWIDAREVIITDDKHTEANPDWDATQERARAIILPVVKRGIVPVIGGFIGSTGDGVTTTIGREGSDLTATLLGACLGAREVHKLTDVDGIMTGDPRHDKTARTRSRLTFQDADEFARTAGMLHPRTIQPLLVSGIPLVIRNINKPEHPGTRIANGN